jgi:hypothetical protein
VERLLGETIEGEGCPLAYLGHPDVVRAARLHRWWSKGEIAARGPLSAVEVDAVDAVEDGRQAREAMDADRRQRETEQRRQTASHKGRRS